MRQGQSAFNRKAKLLTKYLRVFLEPVPYAHFWGHRGFWRPSNNIYVRDGVHLNLGDQGNFYLFIYLFAMFIQAIQFSNAGLNGGLAMLLLFCCEPLYSSVTPLLCYWVRFVMATQVNYSSLELIVAFSVFVNAMFAGDGLIYVSCSGEYFECAILLDRLYLGVSSMHLDILFQDTMLCMERQHCLMSTSLIICGAFYVICGAAYIICGAFHIIRTTFLIICGTSVMSMQCFCRYMPCFRHYMPYFCNHMQCFRLYMRCFLRCMWWFCHYMK